MKHDARAVANSLIERSQEVGHLLTPLQIMKLVYFCHGWMLGLYKRPLIKQTVQAWQYGPVVAELYHDLKQYGGDPVQDKINVAEERFDELEADLIDQVYSKYGQLSGIELSRLTHAPETPWYQVWSQKGKYSAIPNSWIQEHYAEKAGDA